MMQRSLRRVFPGPRADRRHREQGGVYVLFVLLLFPFLGLLAMAIDSSALFAYNLQQYNNAEYAAISALRYSIDTSTGMLDQSKIVPAMSRAEQIAGSNRYVSKGAVSPVANGELRFGQAGGIQFGRWNESARTFTAGPDCTTTPSGSIVNAMNAVRVELKSFKRGSISTAALPIFSKALGHGDLNSRSVGVAVWDQVNGTVRIVQELAPPAPRNVLDVNGDGIVSSVDVSLVINHLNHGTGYNMCYDTDGDGYVAPIDSLRIINYINAGGS